MSNVGDNPEWVNDICERVAARIARIDGIRAIALGGSHARGTARDDSDVDIALYYDSASPFPLDRLDRAACELDDRHFEGLMTEPGAWGPGVNGGGWLIVDGHHVDLLYRDLNRVREVLRRCVRGEIEAVYQLGHPLGFQNQIYAGETHVCRPLYDPLLELGSLKRMVEGYPPRMRHALVDKHLFDAQFEIEIAVAPAARGDLVYVSQCFARATGFMVLVLYALNQRFFLNEKNAFVESTQFPLLPEGFHGGVTRVIGSLGNSSAELARSAAAMRDIAADLQKFCATTFPAARA